MADTTLLLSSVTKPFGPEHGDGFSTQPIGLWQNCWVQGLFIPENVVKHWGLDLIAVNLATPTRVLHYPTLERFTAELRRRRYDYVGISFNACTYHKMLPMVEAVRRVSPTSRIILGGYGTTMSDAEIGHLAEHICREEAIGFMRRLLGEPERPFKHPVVTAQNKIFSLPILGETGMICAGLGCPNGCDFCITSHYFRRKHIRYLETGQDIVDTIEMMRRAKPGLESFCIYDEDLLLNRRRGRQFLEAMRASDLAVDISCFASMKALSYYEVSELAEMGISAIWIGYEGQRAGYAKMNGTRSYRDLIDECRRYNINIVLSMIIGFDYQTPEIIREELADFISLEPAVPQFLIYGPSGGTPLLRRMVEEERLNSDYADLSRHEGFSLLFHHPHIERDEMRALLDECFEREYHENGPTIYRTMQTALIAYQHLRGSSVPRLRVRAERCRAMLEQAWPAYPVGIDHAPNERVRQRIERLYADIARVCGEPPLSARALGQAARAAALWTKARQHYHINMQPPTHVHDYNWPPRIGARALAPLAQQVSGAWRRLAGGTRA